MVVAPVLWSMAGVLTRQIQSAGAFEMAFWRSSFAAVFVFCALLWLQGRRPWQTLRAAGVPGLVSGAMWAVMFTAVHRRAHADHHRQRAGDVQPGAAVHRAPRRLLPARADTGAQPGSPSSRPASAWRRCSAPDSRRASRAHLAGMALALTIPIAGAVNLVVLRKSAAHLDLMPAVMLGALISAAVTLPLALPFQASARDLLVLATLGVFQLGVPCMLLVLVSRTLHRARDRAARAAGGGARSAVGLARRGRSARHRDARRRRHRARCARGQRACRARLAPPRGVIDVVAKRHPPV